MIKEQWYIALLRGINISGKNKVPMANLKKSFEALGWSHLPVVYRLLCRDDGRRYLPAVRSVHKG